MKALFLLCSCFAFSNASLWDLLTKITGTKGQCSTAPSFKDPLIATDPMCEAKADLGDCTFYDCFEDRYSCGLCGFPKTYDLYNCEKMHMPLYLDSFTPQGQKFVLDAGKCLTLFMKSLYRLDRLSCDVVKHQMEEKVTECFISSGFCDILMENRNALWSVYNVKKILKNPKIVGEVMEISKNCSEQISTWAFGHQTDITKTQTNINSGLSQLINAFGKK
ncbi:unnamed protein product [Mytilus edulis]|uniref:Stanniocalcin-like protein n=1 Tax=Mytilus edulis TaxID=6550 RepID=A0A8S3QK26_MYTED|nr:unnamed protein product [Mytilus edulis]